ncbi:hypothetical protein M427DRAFT_281796 [Gonapodya prolifera JEL478]|uniref:Uncharacterized protein n=1 Tax=Gonapodya prolifera (strain JEL478) TaxID=1344416 RepID=A0A139AYU9_GONPJ|nr:hypothetical protein M427DRAFT_281796 [Gonapodya prolifera JEL478]|eukprot:KXS21911.1 hypothetical protein M427DRAFT_281796 [Gonapodya prolifera JEL478]
MGIVWRRVKTTLPSSPAFVRVCEILGKVVYNADVFHDIAGSAGAFSTPDEMKKYFVKAMAKGPATDYFAKYEVCPPFLPFLLVREHFLANVKQKLRIDFDTMMTIKFGVLPEQMGAHIKTLTGFLRNNPSFDPSEFPARDSQYIKVDKVFLHLIGPLRQIFQIYMLYDEGDRYRYFRCQVGQDVLRRQDEIDEGEWIDIPDFNEWNAAFFTDLHGVNAGGHAEFQIIPLLRGIIQNPPSTEQECLHMHERFEKELLRNSDNRLEAVNNIREFYNIPVYQQCIDRLETGFRRFRNALNLEGLVEAAARARGAKISDDIVAPDDWTIAREFPEIQDLLEGEFTEFVREFYETGLVASDTPLENEMDDAIFRLLKVHAQLEQFAKVPENLQAAVRCFRYRSLQRMVYNLKKADDAFKAKYKLKQTFRIVKAGR